MMVHYFAYGSNMSTPRLRRRIVSASFVCVARLPGYRLMFHKAGMDGSAKCDAWSTGQVADVVQGVIFAIAHAQLRELDRVEGEGRGYRRTEVEVFDRDGRGYRVATYCATHIDATLKPFDWYRLHVLQGAREHGLPEDYIRAIARVCVRRDPDERRRRREMRIHGRRAEAS